MNLVVAFPRQKVKSHVGLTRKQLQALRFIDAYIAARGGWPSFVEVQEAIGLGSKMGAVRVVNQLFRADAIARPAHLPNQGEKE